MTDGSVLGEFLGQRGYRPIPLNKSAVGHFEVEARINGQEVLMIVDTGASQSVLDTKSAASMGLDQEECAERATGAGGSLQVSMAQVDALDVQSVTMAPIAMPIVSLDHCNVVLEEKGARRVDGVIGADFLGQKAAIIEYANGTLFLKDESRD